MSRKQRKQPRGVVDTSVLISGIAAFKKPKMKPETDSGKLLYKWIEEGHFKWLYSEDILEEYKAIMKRCGVRPHLVGAIINLLREEAELVRVSETPSVSPDPGDDPICACTEAGDADFIVTLNKKDFPQGRVKAKIIAPGEPVAAKARQKRKS